MQDLGYELPRIPILRTPVNKGWKGRRRSGACAKSPAPLPSMEL